MINKIKNSLKNQDSKSLIENFLSLSALQAFGMILPLITLPYILRVLGVSNYGWIVLANSLVSYFISITDYSFRITATRDVAVFKSNSKKINLIYSKVMMVKSLLLILSIIVIILIVYLYKPFYAQREIFFLTIPMLIGYTLFPEWFFQGIEKMRYITILNLSVKLFFTICVFIFIKEREDYWMYPMLQSLGFVGSGIIAQVILIRNYKLKLLWLKTKMIKSALKSNSPIFVNQFLPTLYNNTSTFLLGVLTNTTLVGLYDAIKKVNDLSITLISIISRVFFPFLNRKRNAFRDYRNLMFLVGATLTIAPLVFYDVIFWYLDIKHAQAFQILLLLSLGVIGLTLYDVFGVNYFIVYRKDKVIMKNTLIASFLGALLSYPLILNYEVIGAAITISFARSIMGLSLLYKYLKLQQNYV